MYAPHLLAHLSTTACYNLVAPPITATASGHPRYCLLLPRCGRTARGQKVGLAIALVSPREAGRWQALGRAMDRIPPPAFPLELRLMPQVDTGAGSGMWPTA